jgi:alkylated DNA repair protein (DNA oxidative demethylase)
MGNHPVATSRTAALTRAAELSDGFVHKIAALDAAAQSALLEALDAALAHAPLYVPTLPRTSAAMRVRMSNLGPLGWVTDKERGYRYQAHHPLTGAPWPLMPPLLLDLWARFCPSAPAPEACLVNVYGEGARLGLHVDADEAATDAPVLSISLGDDALFRIGGLTRADPTRSLWLRSGDVVVLGGVARRCFHGVDRIAFGSSDLLPGGGRINLTLRRVTAMGA